jgi:hypothetical protein
MLLQVFGVSGSDAYYLWSGVDWNNFNAKWEELSKQNLRLIGGACARYPNAWKGGKPQYR